QKNTPSREERLFLADEAQVPEPVTRRFDGGAEHFTDTRQAMNALIGDLSRKGVNHARPANLGAWEARLELATHIVLRHEETGRELVGLNLFVVEAGRRCEYGKPSVVSRELPRVVLFPLGIIEERKLVWVRQMWTAVK